MTQYEQETGQPLEFTMASTNVAETKKDVQYLQQLAGESGHEGHDEGKSSRPR